jgi:hypothetical protein
MSPVVRVDGDTYGRLRADRLPRLLKKYRPEAGSNKQVAGSEEQGE